MAEQIIVKFNDKYGIDQYDKLANHGFWRILLYRESKKTKEVMISLIVSEDGLGSGEKNGGDGALSPMPTAE